MKKWKSGRLSTLAGGVLFLSVGIAHAAQITGGPTGLVGPQQTITFDEIVLPQFAAVTNQFAAFGVTFTGVDIDISNNTGVIPSTGFAGSYLISNIQTSIPPIVISFSGPVTDAAFASTDSGPVWTIAAYLGGTGGLLVDTFNIGIPSPPGIGFLGFTGLLFDTITVTGTTATSPSTHSSSTAACLNLVRWPCLGSAWRCLECCAAEDSIAGRVTSDSPTPTPHTR